MMKNISKIFSNVEKGGIQLTTAHRSKGLEAEHVHIIDDFLF
jgi:superfamily I DNA/RNA helicase